MEESKKIENVFEYYDLNLFEHAEFGDRFVTNGKEVVLYQRTCERNGVRMYTVVSRDYVYDVYDNGDKVIQNEDDEQELNVAYEMSVAWRLVEDEDIIKAAALKVCPFDDFNEEEQLLKMDYIDAFSDGFKKALGLNIVDDWL